MWKGPENMDNYQLYKDIQVRTNGEIYIGVVGPVRTENQHLLKDSWMFLFCLI